MYIHFVENELCYIISADGSASSTGEFDTGFEIPKQINSHNRGTLLTNYSNTPQVCGMLVGNEGKIKLKIGVAAYVIGTLVIPKSMP